MSLTHYLAAASLFVAATAAHAEPVVPEAGATAMVKTADGKSLGKVTLTDGPTGVLLHIDLAGLTAGWHGLHFHQTGDCSDPKFQKSGAHLNHADHKKPHGLLNLQGPDFGDLPNLFVAQDGTAKAEFFSALVSIKSKTSREALLDADGSALVIHANADDHISQPLGGAGDRIACGVIEAAK